MMLSKQSGAGHPEISTFSISNAAAAAFLHAIHFLPSLLRLGKLEILCRDLGGSAATPFLFLSHIVAALDLKKHIATAHNTRRKFSLTTTTVFYWCVMPADLVFEHHWTSRPSFTSSTWCLNDYHYGWKLKKLDLKGPCDMMCHKRLNFHPSDFLEFSRRRESRRRSSCMMHARQHCCERSKCC